MFEKMKLLEYSKYENLEDYADELIVQEMDFFIDTQLYNNKERNVSKLIKEIAITLYNSIPEFKSRFSKNGDTFVGFMILGSWAYLKPSPDADLDLVIITDGPITTKSSSVIRDELKYLMPKDIDKIQYLDCQFLDISNPISFNIFNFPNSVLLIRNFILLTDTSKSFSQILDLISQYYHNGRLNKS